MALTPLQFISGLSSLILVIIFIIVGITIALKYRKTKERMYIFFGITWIGVVEAYIAVSISFIVALFNEVGLPEDIYFLIGISFYPLTTLIWITAFTDIVFKDKQRIFQIIFLIIGTIFEIVFLYLLFTPAFSVGKKLSPVDSEYGLIVSIYIFFSLAVILSTGLIIAVTSMRSDTPEIKNRGFFLLLALITFVIGAAFDLFELNILLLTIIRLILISSAFEFYIAFVMPRWARKLLIKQE